MIGPAGISYERSALAHWLDLRETDPISQDPLDIRDCYANLSLRSMIAAWAQAQAAEPEADGSSTSASALAEPAEPAAKLAAFAFAETHRRRKPNARRRARGGWQPLASNAMSKVMGETRALQPSSCLGLAGYSLRVGRVLHLWSAFTRSI